MTRWLVVGGGSAGCVVAARLAARHDVVVLEAGPDHGAAPPLGDRGPLLTDPARLRSGVVVRRRDGGPIEPYAQGFGLGGSSLVNGAIAVPGGPGTGSPPGHRLPLESPAPLGPVARALRDADADTVELLQVRRDGRRITVADAYLRPMANRMDIRTGIVADRLLLDGRRAVGVVTSDGDEVLADEVVVCAGAIETPALLLRSGIDTPGVGEGLCDQPAVFVALELRGRHDEAPTIGAAVRRGGAEILSLERLDMAPGFGGLMAGLTRVASTGRVASVDGRTEVTLGQLAISSDVARLTAVAGAALDLCTGPALQSVVEGAYIDGAGTPIEAVAGDRAAIERWVVASHGGYHHVAGSCRRGHVTDDAGRVAGYEGLRLADASLLTTAGRDATNVYLAVVLQAEELAATWLAAPDGAPR